MRVSVCVCVYDADRVIKKRKGKKMEIKGGDEIRLLSVKLICESAAGSLIQSDTFAPGVNWSPFFSSYKKRQSCERSYLPPPPSEKEDTKTFKNTHLEVN